jgi:hypothetical protein
MEYDYYSYYDGETPRWKVERKNLFRNAGHIPNKLEAKKIRQLMAETGLTEEELRKHKKYRKILSEAQKPEVKEKSDPVLKAVTKTLKLAKEHPDVLFVYNHIMKKNRTNTHKYSCYKEAKDALESKEYAKYKLSKRIKKLLKK